MIEMNLLKNTLDSALSLSSFSVLTIRFIQQANEESLATHSFREISKFMKT